MRRTPRRRRTTRQQAGQDAVNRADSLAGVIANLDNYQQVSNVDVTFGFNKSVLTQADKDQLDQFGGQLNAQKSYILEVTGGTDNVGSKEYNYQLSDKRAMAVVQYLASKYNVPAHKFYLVGLGKDVQVAPDTHEGGARKESPRRSAAPEQCGRCESGSDHDGQPATAGNRRGAFRAVNGSELAVVLLGRVQRCTRPFVWDSYPRCRMCDARTSFAV